MLWEESDANRAARLTRRAVRVIYPSGHSVNGFKASARAAERGGTTPFNVIPVANTASINSAGANGHGAGTPYTVADWWTRYICPPGGVVCDPFTGSGTTGVACCARGVPFVGIEMDRRHFDIACERISNAHAQGSLLSHDEPMQVAQAGFL